MSELRFEKATLTYSGNDRPAVNAFDLTVKDGEFLVLVGPVGAEYSVQAIDLGILCGRTGGHDRHARAVRTLESRPTYTSIWVRWVNDLRWTGGVRYASPQFRAPGRHCRHSQARPFEGDVAMAYAPLGIPT